MSDENNISQGKNEVNATEEINTDIPNVNNEEQYMEIGEEHISNEGEEYNVEEVKEEMVNNSNGEEGLENMKYNPEDVEQREYNGEDVEEEAKYNIVDGRKEGKVKYNDNINGEINEIKDREGISRGENNSEEEREEKGQEEERDKQIEGEDNNVEEIKNERKDDKNKLNKKQIENDEEEEQNELVDYTLQENIEKKKEQKREVKDDTSKEKNEKKNDEIEQDKEISYENEKKEILSPFKETEHKYFKKGESTNLNLEKPEIIKIVKPKTQLKPSKKKEEAKNNNGFNPEEKSLIMPKNVIHPPRIHKKDENNNIKEINKKEIKPQVKEKELKEQDFTRARHIFISNKTIDESNKDQNGSFNQKSNYQFHCTVVTKKKQPIEKLNNTQKSISNPLFKPISKQVSIYPKNIQVQNTSSNITKITNVVQPRSQYQQQQNKKITPVISSYQNKYQPKKNEPSKQKKTAKVDQTRIQIIRKNQPQSKDIKKTQIQTTPNQYQQRKNDIIIKTNNNNAINNSNLNKKNEIKINTQSIFSSRTSDNKSKDSRRPKLKYYAICPNCGYHLKEESTINNFNKTLSNGYNTGFRNDIYNSYDNKTFNKTDKKTANYSIYNTTNIKSNNKRNIYENQNKGIQKSMDNLEKEKDRNPSNNIVYYQSSYGTSKKSKYTPIIKK